MSRILFYDTETSGMPLWDKPSTDRGQPHIVQLYAALVDSETRSTLQQVDLLIRPDGWEIDPETTAVHGITQERALAEGVPEHLAVVLLFELWQLADLRVAHVETFDARIQRIGMKRFGYGDKLADLWKDGPAACTAKLSKPAVRPEGAKVPKLADAYRHFTGQELTDAHTARADVLACMAVYWAVIDGSPRREQFPEA